ASTGTIAMIEPPGIPGMLKLVTTDVATTVAICVGTIATPYNFARKPHPIVIQSVSPTRKRTVASGMKNPVISSGSDSRVFAVSISAGSAASDDRDENATACGGSEIGSAAWWEKAAM